MMVILRKLAMFLLNEGRPYDEQLGFPSALRPAAGKACALVVKGESNRPTKAFLVNAAGEQLHIPYRVYYDARLFRGSARGADREVRRMLLCLGTRHHDGLLRQECLRALRDVDAPWLLPYVVQLAGEYVVEIAEDVVNDLVARDPAALRAFAMDNPDYLATFARRVTSYWNCYYRQTYPDRNDYPGTKVLSMLRQALF